MPIGALPLALLLAASGLSRVRAHGEIRWAGDWQGGEPYVFRDPRNPDKLVGFEVDLVRALAAKLGVRERFFQNDWSNLVPSLERGDFDIIVNGLEDTPALRGRILLSRPYSTSRSSSWSGAALSCARWMLCADIASGRSPRRSRTRSCARNAPSRWCSTAARRNPTATCSLSGRTPCCWTRSSRSATGSPSRISSSPTPTSPEDRTSSGCARATRT